MTLRTHHILGVTDDRVVDHKVMHRDAADLSAVELSDTCKFPGATIHAAAA